MTKSFKKLKLSEKSRVSVPNLVKIISFQTRVLKPRHSVTFTKRKLHRSHVELPSGLSNSQNKHKIENYDKWNAKRLFRWTWTNLLKTCFLNFREKYYF